MILKTLSIAITCPNIGPKGGPAAAIAAGIKVRIVPCLTFSTAFFMLFSLFTALDIFALVFLTVLLIQHRANLTSKAQLSSVNCQIVKTGAPTLIVAIYFNGVKKIT